MGSVNLLEFNIKLQPVGDIAIIKLLIVYSVCKRIPITLSKNLDSFDISAQMLTIRCIRKDGSSAANKRKSRGKIVMGMEPVQSRHKLAGCQVT